MQTSRKGATTYVTIIDAEGSIKGTGEVVSEAQKPRYCTGGTRQVKSK